MAATATWALLGALTCRPTPTDVQVAAMDLYAQGGSVDLLLTVKQGDALGLRHRRSLDGGRTWLPATKIPLGEHPIGRSSRGNDSQIAAFGDRLVALWSTRGDSRFGAGPMASAISADGGRTWKPGPSPSNRETHLAQNFFDLAVDPEGSVYVAWLESFEGVPGRALAAARSRDFGASWEASQVIHERTCECCWNKLLAPAAREVRLLYRDRAPRDMALASSSDGGATWARSGIVGAFDWDYSGCPHVGGALARARATSTGSLHALVWTGAAGHVGLHWLRSADRGATWSAPRKLGGPLARHADIAASGSDLAACWDEEGAILVATSPDSGRHWTEPRRISAEVVTASHPLIVASQGRFMVFWTERNEASVTTWRSVPLD